MSTCAYCALEIPTPRRARETTHEEPEYCCLGCRLASSITRDRGPGARVQGTLVKLALAIFCSMNVMVFSMTLWTHDVYADSADSKPGTEQVLKSSLDGLSRHACLLLSLPVLFLLGGPLARTAWVSLRRGRPSTDVLLVLGVASAAGYSIFNVARGAGQVYFEVACAVLVAVTLGRWLEASGKLRTSESLLALERLLPAHSRRLVDGEERLVPTNDLIQGDRIRVLPGERIGADARILAGTASLDERILSGESLPVVRSVGDFVHGGAMNVDGDLQLEILAPVDGGTLSKLLAIVRRARLSRGHYQKLADRVSAWFLPLVAMISWATFVYHARQSGFEAGMLSALAVVLIACPCALGLATPMAIWAALGTAAKRQIVVSGGDVLERLARVRAVCFDKTNTLTTGETRARHWSSDASTESDQILARVGGLTQASTHCLDVALRQLVTQARVAPACVSDWRAIPGRGLVARCANEESLTCLGNLRLMGEHALGQGEALGRELREMQEAGRPLVCIGWKNRIRGAFSFEEALRAEAPLAIERCHELGLRVHALTGDHAARARQIAQQLKIHVQADLLPEQKVEALHQLRQAAGAVAMVGDGINDACALASADVGLALGCGADLAREAADVCLLSNDLLGVPWTIQLARRTVWIIRQNLFWSFAYNVLGIALACTGRLSPIWASGAMVLSSALVVGNSLRLARDVP